MAISITSHFLLSQKEKIYKALVTSPAHFLRAADFLLIQCYLASFSSPHVNESARCGSSRHLLSFEPHRHSLNYRIERCANKCNPDELFAEAYNEKKDKRSLEFPL